MTGWTVLWRGIRHRAGRSLLVLLMATVATTAAAVVPAYVHGAQESVVRDLLGPGSAADTSVQVQLASARNSPGTPPQPTLADGTTRVEAVVAQSPTLSKLVARKVSHAETNLKFTAAPAGDIVSGRLIFRPDSCAQVTVSGRCPTAPGEVMVSARTAEYYHLTVGGRLPIALGKEADEGRTSKAGGGGLPPARESTAPTVVSLYTPKDSLDPYWATGSLLGFSPLGDPHLGAAFWNVDAVFAGVAPGVEAFPGVLVRKTVIHWLDLDAVDSQGIGRLDTDLRTATREVSLQQMTLRSGLPALITEIRRDQDAVAATVPIGAVPLLVLALAVLMVLVAALTEERGPEIALARLHGYANSRVGAFGLGEVLFLITLAAPLGLVLSRIVLAVMSALWLAPGTSGALTWQPFAAVGIALLAAYVSAAVASRRVFRTRIVNLLRRVPQRTTWRAGALEGAAVALAVAALVTAAQDRGSGLAILTAPLLAIVTGIVGGRLLSVTAAARLRRARRQADATGMLTSAALARRPGRQRIVVVAVATSLMGFSATAWDVATQARAEAANSMVGAWFQHTGADLAALARQLRPRRRRRTRWRDG